MKEVIDNFIRHNKSIADFIERTSDSYQEGNDVLPQFAKKLNESQYNIALGNIFADLLQLSISKSVYEQYSLEDISSLYSSLIQVQEANLENYVDAAYFEFSVMDNAGKAKQIINSGLEKARQTTEELQRLLESVNIEQVP